MAKPQLHLVPPKLEVVVHNVPCGCGCGMINLNEHEHIHSKSTGEYYADEYCLVKYLEGEWVEGWIKLEWGTGWKLLTKYQLYQEYEVTEPWKR